MAVAVCVMVNALAARRIAALERTWTTTGLFDA